MSPAFRPAVDKCQKSKTGISDIFNRKQELHLCVTNLSQFSVIKETFCRQNVAPFGHNGLFWLRLTGGPVLGYLTGFAILGADGHQQDQDKQRLAWLMKSIMFTSLLSKPQKLITPSQMPPMARKKWRWKMCRAVTWFNPGLDDLENESNNIYWSFSKWPHPSIILPF